ncbi:MAG: 2-oxo acid dehydrogenase subunit E2 [Polyangiaceae bacterium]|nr:2-oxo acid dehydrogenase subunit E2 [Polyangiaceae bacterium]
MIDVPMPQLGESVAEGTVTKWVVREGDQVEREQVLLEVATDKADTEVRAPAAGRVVKIVAQEGQTIAKGGLLCQLDETATGGARPAAAPQAAAPQPAPAAPPSAQGSANAPLASPSVRKMAREHDVEIARVHGTGDQGRVTQGDVLRAAGTTDGGHGPHVPPVAVSQPTVIQPQAQTHAQPQAAPAQPAASSLELAAMLNTAGGFVPPIPGVGFGTYKVPPYVPKPGDQVVPFSRRRRITADHMVYSKQVSPHVATVAEVDLAATSRLRDQHKDVFKKEGVPLTFLTFISIATVRALREHPDMNARVLEGSYVKLRDVNLGVAVDTPGGLVVPSIKQADQLSLRGIASAIDDLAQRAKAGKVTADDLSGTSFSISNPGLKGNLFGAAIISQPNVGILRMGEIKKRPVVVTNGNDESIAIHPVMYLALSYDHRIIDGALANSFLWRVADILNRGEFEVR